MQGFDRGKLGTREQGKLSEHLQLSGPTHNIRHDIKKEDDNQVAQFLSKQSSHVYLFEHKRLFLVDWIDTIIWYNFCLVLSSDSVGRQAKHIYFNIGTDLLFW